MKKLISVTTIATLASYLYVEAMTVYAEVEPLTICWFFPSMCP